MSTTDSRPRFPRPPTTFTDGERRRVTVETYDGGPEPLTSMYARFDDGSRAQGVPPRGGDRLDEWVRDLLAEGSSLVARHGEEIVGHTVLVPFHDAAELAVFVRPDYQGAGVGTQLVHCVLGYGQAIGIERIRLVVSRSNRIALTLYRSAGFETIVSDRGDVEMALAL